MLYNEYNDNNQYAIKIMSIAIVFLEIFIFLKINGTYSQKRGLIAMVDFLENLVRFVTPKNFPKNFPKKYFFKNYVKLMIIKL